MTTSHMTYIHLSYITSHMTYIHLSHITSHMTYIHLELRLQGAANHVASEAADATKRQISQHDARGTRRQDRLLIRLMQPASQLRQRL